MRLLAFPSRSKQGLGFSRIHLSLAQGSDVQLSSSFPCRRGSCLASCLPPAGSRKLLAPFAGEPEHPQHRQFDLCEWVCSCSSCPAKSIPGCRNAVCKRIQAVCLCSELPSH